MSGSVRLVFLLSLTLGGVAQDSPRIVLRAGLATTQAPAGWVASTGEPLRRIVEEHWHGTPDASVLAAFTPAGAAPGDARAIHARWLAVGHVPEQEAADLAPDALLALLRAEAAASGEKLAAQGKSPVEVLGLVEPPRYDQKRRAATFVWRTRAGAAAPTLVSYSSRILARTGALVFEAIGPEAALAELTTAVSALLASTEIASGQRYEDFVAGEKLGTWKTVEVVAVGVWDRLPLWQKIGLGMLALLAVLKIVSWFRGR